MKLAVCGGRDYRLTTADRFLLLDLDRNEGIDLLLHGGCRGADLDAAAWAQERGIPTREYTAAWKLHGKAAGPMRGRAMVDDCDVLMAFPGGAGTQAAVTYARSIGKEVIQWGEHEPADTQRS